MSGPPSLSSAPFAYLEYEAGSAYPSITNLPPLSYSGPNGNGSMSSKAQALRDRLANAENDFDAGEDGDNYATAFSKTRSKQVASNAAPPIVPALTARPPPITTPMYQTNSVNPISQLPTFQQSQGVNVLPSGSMQEENSMHAYAPPGWHQQVISQQQPIGHSPIQQPRIQQHIDPQLLSFLKQEPRKMEVLVLEKHNQTPPPKI